MSGKARRREQKSTAHDRKVVADETYQVEIPDAVPKDLAEDARWALSFKQHAVVENMFGVGDIPPLVSLYRDGEQILRAFSYEINRDLALEFIRIAAPGFGADAVTLVADAHMIDERFANEKGRMPDPHELQHLCDGEGACELGLTTDAIMMTHAQRGDDQRMRAVSFPYHVNKRAREVHWQPDVHVMGVGDGVLVGYTPNALTAYMNTPVADISMMANDRWLVDMHLLAVLTMIGFPVMWASDTDEERERVGTFLSEVGLSQNGKKPTGVPPVQLRYMATKLRMEIQANTDEVHAAEMAETARRRAERGEMPAAWVK